MPPSTAAEMAAATVRHHGKHIPEGERKHPTRRFARSAAARTIQRTISSPHRRGWGERKCSPSSGSMGNFTAMKRLVLLSFCALTLATRAADSRPNILLCIADDASCHHFGANGDKVCRTPNFDRVALEGVNFTRAFCSSPSCTPSRGALLTGQDFWRLEDGANLWSRWPNRFAVYPYLLAKAGYHVGLKGCEIERFDREISAMLKLLEDAGQLGNTLVVVTSDNGFPFPRGKATCYDAGTRMPLAVRWPARAKGGRAVDDFVSLTDLAPTFLEAAGLKPLPEMTGHSLLSP